MTIRNDYEDMHLLNKTPIQKYFYGTNVFITGGTGFFGKVLIEKLIRSCTDINKIYLLVRTKKGKTIEERLSTLFDQAVFDRLKLEVPNYREKILLIQGDCAQPNLGLSETDMGTLTTNVNIVFHAAATVSFDEKIRLALDINVKGTKCVLDLCKRCINLKSVVYISTAYSNCNKPEIDEKFYEPPADPEKILKFVENTSDENLDKLTPRMIGKHPNTYAYSKALAEDVVKRNSQNLPLTVLRPSIVIGSRKEPIPGWIDNFYGPSGVVAGVGAGLLRTMRADFNVIADIVPVDMVVNAAVAAAANPPSDNDIPILNYVSSCGNPVTWGDYFYWNMHFGQLYASVKSIWYYTLTATKHKSLYLVYSLFLHFLPALLIDACLVATFRKPKMVKVYKKIYKFCEVITYFSTQEWKFHEDNLQNLWMKMANEDKELFHFNIRDLEWDVYFFENIKSMRSILIKDTNETLDIGRKRMTRLKILHYTLKHAFMILGLYIFYSFIVKFIISF